MSYLCRWAIAKGAVKGRGHEKNGLPCQDQVASFYKGESFVIALSDGAGSCRKSKIGARVLTQKACLFVCENFSRLFGLSEADIRQEVFSILFDQLNKTAREANCQVKDLSATLAFFSCQGGKFISGHLGDGVIGVLEKGRLKTFSNPQRGEFANQTFFLNSKESMPYFRIYKGENLNIDGVVILSDGSCDSLYDKKKQLLAPVVRQVLDWPLVNSVDAINQALAKSLNESIRTSTQDDCSVVLARKRTYSTNEFFNLAPLLQRDFYFDKPRGFFKNHIRVLKEYLENTFSDPTGKMSHHIVFLKSYLMAGDAPVVIEESSVSGKCIVCLQNKEMTEEHIIPESLGGSLKSSCLCRECNSNMGSHVDVPLINSILMELPRFTFGIKGKTGEIPNPFKTGVLPDGRKARFDSKLKPTMAPTFQENITGAGATEFFISLDASQEREIPSLIKKIVERRLSHLSSERQAEEVQKVTGLAVNSLEKREYSGSYKFECKQDFGASLFEFLKIAYEMAFVKFGYEYIEKSRVAPLLRQAIIEKRSDLPIKGCFPFYNTFFNQLFSVPTKHYVMFLNNACMVKLFSMAAIIEFCGSEEPFCLSQESSLVFEFDANARTYREISFPSFLAGQMTF